MEQFNKSKKADTSVLQYYKSQILEGNVNAYEKLLHEYDIDNYVEFLPYALLMANKYDYDRAYFEVFQILIYIEGCSIDYDLSCIDERTKKQAIDYLILAIQKGNSYASKILLEYNDSDKSYPIRKLYADQELIQKAKLNIISK